MKCPRCKKELQPNWQVCPSCGMKITAVRICPKCKEEIEERSTSCPHCGLVMGETPSVSASINDSFIKEIHQTQNIYNESRPLGTPEYQYEKYVLAVLESGGSLERARTQLEQRREQLGLSLKQSKEVEEHCLALNKNIVHPIKSEETQNPKITANISSGNGISKVTGQNRLPKWGILVGCVAILIIGGVVFINNKHTPDRVPSITSAQNTTSSQVSPATTSTSIKTATIPSTSSITSVSVHAGTPISYGQVVIGKITNSGDYQDWTFTGQAGDVITIRGVQNGGASLAPGIKLLDPSGSLVADAAGDATNDVTAIIMNYSLRFSGVYTIRVYGFAGYGSNYSTGGYQLSLRGPPPVGSLVYGQTVTGIIAQTGDYQDWTFTGQAGDVITIRGVQNGGASLAPGIKLLDPSGSLVADAAGDATNDVTAIIMNYSLRFSGVYTIRVYGFAGYGSNYSTGGYQLSLIKK